MSATPGKPLLEVEGLYHEYPAAGGSLPVLCNLDLELYPGHSLALLGRSGSGKSTLLNLLAGIDRPIRGSIRLLGEELSRLDEQGMTRVRRRSIGFVYQFFNLIPSLTLAENIALPLELNRVPESELRARVDYLLEAVGLGGRGDAFPDQISGGEQQRVAIARALAHRPALLLADEPTGNLDATTGRQVLELLLELSREAGHALLLVTHSRMVAESADRQLVLDRGRLVEPGRRGLAW